MTKKSKEIYLSPSALKLFRECPRCFYQYKVKGIHRPPLNFALQSNIDRILKVYFDGFRKQGILPPELEGQVQGKLFDDQATLERWRDAMHPTLTYREPDLPGFFLGGGIDDCLDERGVLAPVDYKTTGGSNFEETSEQYYQHQLDIYDLLIREQGRKTKGCGYLVYYKPEEIVGSGMIRFRTVVKQMETKPARAIALFREAAALLRGTLPPSHSTCTYCSWGEVARTD